MKTARKRRCAAADNHGQAFTLVELLVVIAIIAMLASILLPALSGAKASAKQSSCLGDLRQLEVAFQMYASDNASVLPENVEFQPEADFSYGTNAWVYGNMKNASDATNAPLVAKGELFPYTPQAGTYHCPADTMTGSGGPRVRSYAMNAWIGSSEMEAQQEQTPFRVYLKDRDLAAGMPSAIWVLIDEHTATLDDGWFKVTMDDSQPFASEPATRHQNAYALNFADGHAEIFRLRTPVTQIPETQSEAFAANLPPEIPANNLDWIKLKSVTTSP